MTLDDFINLSNKERMKYVNSLFSDSASLLQIKKLLLLKSKDKFDSELVSIGICSSIFSKNDSFINLLFEFAEKNNKNLEVDDLRTIINVAFLTNRLDLVERFDNKFNIIKKDLKQERVLELDESGVVKHGFGISDGYTVDESPSAFAHYQENVFILQLKNHNTAAISYLLKEENKVENSLIESEVIEAIENKDEQILLILLSEPRTRKVIEESAPLALYLNESTQDKDMKQRMKIIELNLQLERDLLDKKNCTKKHKL